MVTVTEGAEREGEREGARRPAGGRGRPCVPSGPSSSIRSNFAARHAFERTNERTKGPCHGGQAICIWRGKVRGASSFVRSFVQGVKCSYGPKVARKCLPRSTPDLYATAPDQSRWPTHSLCLTDWLTDCALACSRRPLKLPSFLTPSAQGITNGPRLKCSFVREALRFASHPDRQSGVVIISICQNHHHLQ